MMRKVKNDMSVAINIMQVSVDRCFRSRVLRGDIMFVFHSNIIINLDEG